MIYIGSPVLAWTTVLGRRKFQRGIRQKECLNCSRAQYHSRKYISVEPKYDTPVCWLYSLATRLVYITWLGSFYEELAMKCLNCILRGQTLREYYVGGWLRIIQQLFFPAPTQCDCHGISISPLPVQHYHCLTVSVIQATIYTTCSCGGTLLTQASEMNPLR